MLLLCLLTLVITVSTNHLIIALYTCTNIYTIYYSDYTVIVIITVDCILYYCITNIHVIDYHQTCLTSCVYLYIHVPTCTCRSHKIHLLYV